MARPVDGAALLTALAETFTRHALLPEGGAEALALWTLHTYTHEAAYISPILCLSSPQRRCGKTTVLSLLRAIVRRPLPTANVTAAALFRATEQWHPTLLIDEADSFLRDNEELRGVLNSGHTRDMAYVIRTVGDDHEPRAFCTWAPKAIASLGACPRRSRTGPSRCPCGASCRVTTCRTLAAGPAQGVYGPPTAVYALGAGPPGVVEGERPCHAPRLT